MKVNEDQDKAGIYIHIPFCRKACTYCNFHFSTTTHHKSELLSALRHEMVMEKSYLAGKDIATIYLGGGTPSMLSMPEINQLLDTIYNTYSVLTNVEITLEANPDDLTHQYIKLLAQETPINRLSIGVQSFRDIDLQFMNRAHTAKEAEMAIQNCQDAGLGNMSIDLIYGTPHLTNADWVANLEKMYALNIPHFSAYALTVEEKTTLNHLINTQQISPLNSEQAAEQLELLMDSATSKGYEHYEISNFSHPNKYAIHNTNYWRGNHYLGVGPSAHSYNGITRRWNVANNALYTKGTLYGGEHKTEDQLTTANKLNEYIMTSLRTMWGCQLKQIENIMGVPAALAVAAKSEKFVRLQHLSNIDGVLTLTQKGKLFADGIAAELFM